MKGKVIALTGSTHGIGRAIALRLLAGGCVVYGCSHTPGDPNIARLEQNPNYHHATVDVAAEDEVCRWLQACGQIDAAINCAGTGCVPRPLEQLRGVDARRVMDVNLFGTAYALKYEIPLLRRGGTIINVGSIAADTLNTGADWSYAASKAAVKRLTQDLAPRAQELGIHIALLTPGYIETRMTAADDKQLWLTKTPHGKVGKPEEVAGQVVRILKNPLCGECMEYKIIGGGHFEAKELL